MNEVEFRRALERFPVVRKKTYARVEWNSLVRPRLARFPIAYCGLDGRADLRALPALLTSTTMTTPHRRLP